MPIPQQLAARGLREGTRQRLEISLDFLVLGTAQVKIFPQGFQFLRCKRHEIGDRRRRRGRCLSLGHDLRFVLDPDLIHGRTNVCRGPPARAGWEIAMVIEIVRYGPRCLGAGLAGFRVLPSEFVTPDARGLGASQRGSVACFVEARSAERAPVLTILLLTLDRGANCESCRHVRPERSCRA